MKFYAVADAKRGEAIEPSQRRIARRAMNGIALAEQKARKVGAVLPGDAGDECRLR